ncbi:MAG TPA: hypothetical protein VKY92_09135 [Verrucomicrobiae bacterium]|nr:hypothetical protein [Verrucomicrobiae bacterium]
MLKRPRDLCRKPLLFAAAISVSILLGCSKKQEADAPAPAAASQPAAAPAADAQQQQQQADAAPQQPTGPVLDASQMSGDAKAAMAEADAAIRQREYEKAVRTMLAIQQARLDAQQAALARQQMINLQRNLAAAVASGDPNAKAAADILRAGRGH